MTGHVARELDGPWVVIGCFTDWLWLNLEAGSYYSGRISISGASVFVFDVMLFRYYLWQEWLELFVLFCLNA